MFEQAFRNIDDVLRKEAGCASELDYTEQSSWLLLLKYLAGLEQDRADEASLEGKKYTWILDKPYRWEVWAAPKGKDGKLDHNKALTGDDLRDFCVSGFSDANCWAAACARHRQGPAASCARYAESFVPCNSARYVVA